MVLELEGPRFRVLPVLLSCPRSHAASSDLREMIGITIRLAMDM